MAKKPDSYLRILGKSGGGGGISLEGAGGASDEPDLRDARIQESVTATRDMLSALPGADGTLRDRVVADGETAMKKLATDGASAQLSENEEIGLEAIIVSDGTRPVLFVQDDRVNPASPHLGDWKASLDMFDDAIRTVTKSVGRIGTPMLAPSFAGTGFVVAPGIVVTNRHVLQVIASDSHDAATGQTTWTVHPGATIDFAGEFDRPRTRRYRIESLLFTGPDKIEGNIDFNRLDMAVLKCRVDDGDCFPDPLKLEADAARLTRGREIYALGFPGSAGAESANDISNLFHNTLGFKRWSPGYIDEIPGEVANDPRKWVHTHDASTLGGNSGSCIVDLSNNGSRVVGLHFAGWSGHDNYAHAIAMLQQELGDFGVAFV